MKQWKYWMTFAGLFVSIALSVGCDKENKDEPDADTGSDMDAAMDPDTIDDPLPDPVPDTEPDTEPDIVPDTEMDTLGDPDVEPDVVEEDMTPVDRFVLALYPTNGPLWNDYVKNDGTTPHDGMDTACNGDTDALTSKDECLHAGEMRVYEATTISSCSGVTITDSEGAFDWVCDDAGSAVLAISTGLREGMYLSDLIDWTATPPVWKEMTVTVDDGSTPETSDASSWWTNPIVEDNDGGWLNNPSEIIVITETTPGGDYTINADSIGIVGEPGLIVPGGNTAGAVIAASEKHFLWVEAEIDATSDNYGVGMVSGLSNFVVIRGVTVDGSGNYGMWINTNNSRFEDIEVTNNGWEGLRVTSGWYNEVRNVTATANRTGVQYSAGQEALIEDIVTTDNSSDGLLIGCSNSIVRHVVTANNVQHGVTNGSDNLLYDIEVHNCGHAGTGDGLHITGERNVIANVQISNVDDRGIALMWDNVVVGATIHNAGLYGIQQPPGALVVATTIANVDERAMVLSASAPPSMTTLMNVAILNSGGGFTTDADTGQYLFVDVATSDNTDITFTDINIDSIATDVVFEGFLIVTDTETSCVSPWGVGVDATCNPAGGSATLVPGSVFGTFVGGPATDATNVSDSAGTAAYDSITDWTEFDRPMRGWGQGSGWMPGTGIRGRCGAGETCQIVDLNMMASASPLIGMINTPTGDQVIVHHFVAGTSLCGDFPGSTWNGTDCEITFLRNAYEVIEDDIGNDNGLCESDETCVFASNIGSYQGHGALVSHTTIGTGGIIENVTLLAYDTNGY